jgi:hypothetical protein
VTQSSAQSPPQPTQDRRPNIFVRTAKVVTLLIVSACAAIGVWHYFPADPARLTVTLVNRSDAMINDAIVMVGNCVLLDFPDIAPGRELTLSVTFPYDLGTSDLSLVCGENSYKAHLPFALLTDNGPFEHKLFVSDDNIRYESYATSKGDTSGVILPLELSAIRLHGTLDAPKQE